MVPTTALGVYAVLILFTRLNGLRSFSTMSAFDFAMTVAVGTVAASTILNPRPSLVEGAAALAMLFVLQRSVAYLRRWHPLKDVLDNRPLLLVHQGKIRADNLRRCHMVPHDLYAKVRSAGLLRLEDVEAAVMETTGNVSVIPRRAGVQADPRLIEDVRA